MQRPFEPVAALTEPGVTPPCRELIDTPHDFGITGKHDNIAVRNQRDAQPRLIHLTCRLFYMPSL